MARYICQSVSGKSGINLNDKCNEPTKLYHRHSVTRNWNSKRDAEIWAKNCNVEGGAHVLCEYANDGIISEGVF